MTLKASFIGLGNMGSAMAPNLLKQGVELAVYNRSKEKALSLVEAGAKLLNHPNEAFNHAPVVISMVANDQALIDISKNLLEGAEGCIKKGCIHISCSTVSPETTKKLALQHQEKGVEFVAAPVFGRPEVAAKHELWICIAGNEAAKKQATPFLNMLGKKIYDFGDKPEAVNVVKLSGNFMILSIIEMMGEAFAVAEQNGINPEMLHAFLADSLFPSPVFQTYGKLIVSKKFSPAGFALTLGKKDLNLFLDAAKDAKTPLADVLKNQLEESIKKGRSDMDWSAISLLPGDKT